MWIQRVLVPGAAFLAGMPICAQYPTQTSKANPDSPEMRAVAVLEWTGEEGHPKASRLVPVSVYDGQDLQDAGIYLPQPAPLALSSEVEYELKENGKTVGLFDINNAGQVQGSWVGFGVWKPLAKPKPIAQATKLKNDDSWGGDVQSDRPVLHRKHGGDDTAAPGKDDGSGSSGQAQDPDRPTLHKKSSSDGSGDSGASTPDSGSGSDPDQPTLHKKTTSDSSDSNAASSGPSTDPDRPTLHKKTSDTDSTSGGNAGSADPDRPKLKKKGATTPSDVGYVESVANSTDPNRPHLLRGKPAGESSDVLPTLMGFPADMHQAVAVSDAKSRPEHLWTYSWSNPDDEAKLKADMEDLARKALGLAVATTPAKAASAPAARRTAVSVPRKAKPAPAPSVPAPLLDEQFRVFELSYGAGATMVLSAHTDGSGAQEKFVTLVAQPDLYGNVVVLLKNVTDAAHLDDTPRMRLIDAVDAIADNRGELLFELRGATQRQFALYRVLRGQADKLFTSGAGGIVPPPKGE